MSNPTPKSKLEYFDKSKNLREIIPEHLRVPFNLLNAQMLPNRIFTRGDNYGSLRYPVKILSFHASVTKDQASNLPIVALLTISPSNKPNDPNNTCKEVLEAYRPDGKHPRNPELDLVIDVPKYMYLDPVDKDKFKSIEDFIFDLSQELRWRIIFREPGTNRPLYKDFKTEQDAWDFISRTEIEDSTKPFPLWDI